MYGTHFYNVIHICIRLIYLLTSLFIVFLFFKKKVVFFHPSKPLFYWITWVPTPLYPSVDFNQLLTFPNDGRINIGGWLPKRSSESNGLRDRQRKRMTTAGEIVEEGRGRVLGEIAAKTFRAGLNKNKNKNMTDICQNNFSPVNNLYSNNRGSLLPGLYFKIL